MQRLGQPAEDLSTRAQKPARRKGSRIYGSALHHQNGGATPVELAPLFCPLSAGRIFSEKTFQCDSPQVAARKPPIPPSARLTRLLSPSTLCKNCTLIRDAGESRMIRKGQSYFVTGVAALGLAVYFGHDYGHRIDAICPEFRVIPICGADGDQPSVPPRAAVLLTVASTSTAASPGLMYSYNAVTDDECRTSNPAKNVQLIVRST